ncbi:DUF3299 domain-containing protein [Paraneptunicella aestuarii]|uniref:DUF3299 domain-containing protein n=1 Tax=Paraneptunicella aestuarii TaxID=2831148 RepID=UPI001E37F5CB|nr:DUF3299 domain-containing protein [Paraneptunicella aestuarii]UAA39054.1 DUF3299 domain-containing protein [Paraneptunicella aestuarii]
MKKLFVALGLLLVTNLGFADEVKELYWEDLVPKDFVMPDTPEVDHNNPMAQMNPVAPIIPELNGQLVKIPGFVVPLEGDDVSLTEFLLVPFFGACIHVPPPPSNQIVYVKFAKPIPVDSLYDPVWVTGKLSTEAWTGEIASVGYRLTGTKVEPFE